MAETIQLLTPKKDQDVVRTRQGLPTHKKRPQARFVYVHYPKGWEYDEEHGFLPILSRLTARPGCNGVPASGSLARPIASAQTKGGVYIDPKDTRLGKYMDYVQYYDCQNGEKWYVDFCAKASVLTSGEIIWNSTDSKIEFDMFRKHLRDAEIVPLLTGEIFNWLYRREQEKTRALSMRANQNPYLQKEADARTKRLDDMLAAWDKFNKAQSTDNAMTPKRKRAKNIIEGK